MKNKTEKCLKQTYCITFNKMQFIIVTKLILDKEWGRCWWEHHFLTHFYHRCTQYFSLWALHNTILERITFAKKNLRIHPFPEMSFNSLVSTCSSLKCLCVLLFHGWSNSIRCSFVNGFAWAILVVLIFPLHQIYIFCMWCHLAVDLY